MKRSSSRPGLALVAGMLLAVGAMTLYGQGPNAESGSARCALPGGRDARVVEPDWQ